MLEKRMKEKVKETSPSIYIQDLHFIGQTTEGISKIHWFP